MKLVTIRQPNLLSILLSWDDLHEGSISVKALRDGCPCAGCKGETVLFQTYVPPTPDANTPGRYRLKGAEPIGSYAIKFAWADGHDLGIYTLDLLRSMCECEECLKRAHEHP